MIFTVGCFHGALYFASICQYLLTSSKLIISKILYKLLSVSNTMSEAQSIPGTQRTAHDLTAFQHNILVILAKEPMYGLATKRELENYYGTEVNHGRLYPNLDDLVDRGLVAKSELDKRTNQYELTDDGYEIIFGQLNWVFSKLIIDDERAEDIRILIERH